MPLLITDGAAKRFGFGAALPSLFAAEVFEVAGAETLLAKEGAVGSWNVTFLGSGVAGAAAFFSSSSFLRNFAMASASKSCFSHFEYDFDWRRPGEPMEDSCFSATWPDEIRRVYVSAGRSKGFMFSPIFVTIESLNAILGSFEDFCGDDHSSCLPVFCGVKS